MTPSELAQLASSWPALPAVSFAVAALVCLVLDAAGAPVGARKVGPRTHLAVVATLPAVVVLAWVLVLWDAAPTFPALAGALVVDRIALLGQGVAAILVGASAWTLLPTLRAVDAERGDAWALLCAQGGALSVLVATRDVLLVLAALVLLLAAVAPIIAPNRQGPHGVEAATKLALHLGVVLPLLGVGAALSGTLSLDGFQTQSLLGFTGLCCVLVGLFSLVGALPVHGTFVDVAHGSSPAAGSALTGGLVVGGGVLLVRVLATPAGAPELQRALVVVAVAGLVFSPLAALDQQRVPRLVAWLCTLPAALLAAALCALPVAQAPAAALLVVGVGALSAGAALLGLGCAQTEPSSTWEDWSSVGRSHPVFAAALLYVLATLVGIPGTAGFVARLAVAKAAFAQGEQAPALGGFWVGILVLCSVAVGIAPVVRLGLFLFAKQARGRVRPSTAPARVIPLCALAVGLGLLSLWPSVPERWAAEAARAPAPDRTQGALAVDGQAR